MDKGTCEWPSSVPDPHRRTLEVYEARAKLHLVPSYAPHAAGVQADPMSLPFARHSIDAAWAERSYVHLDRRVCPVAWWDLHRAMIVGAEAHLGLFLNTDGVASDPTGDTDVDHAVYPEDDFPDRCFSRWDPELLRHVLTGAGFRITSFSRNPDRVAVSVRRERTLADTVGPGMRLLLVGLNPSMYAADAGIGFARPGNRAWPALAASGLATVDRDPLDLLRSHRIGMTDLVKRATARADELSSREFADGFKRLEALCRWLDPGAVCVLGITGWRAATGDRHAVVGAQARTVGGRPVYVAPNPSGLNARTSVDDLVGHLHGALALADS